MNEKPVFFNNSTIFPKSYLVSNKQEYVEFLIRKSDIVSNKVLFYPSKNDLFKIKELSNSYDFIVLYSFQKEEQELVSSLFRKIKLKYVDHELLEFLEIDFSFDEIIDLSKKNDSFKVIYIFMKLWAEFDWNPSWIKGQYNKNKFWHIMTFLDIEKLSKKFDSISHYSKLIKNPSSCLLVNLLYSELSKVRSLEYNFFSKIKLKNPQKISKEELKEFSIEELAKEAIIYCPKKDVYALID